MKRNLMLSQKFLKGAVGESGDVSGRKQQPSCAFGKSESLPISYQCLAESQGWVWLELPSHCGVTNLIVPHLEPQNSEA